MAHLVLQQQVQDKCQQPEEVGKVEQPLDLVLANKDIKLETE